MALSKTAIETLLDLVEIKLSCMEVWDREDRRELQALELAKRELEGLSGGGNRMGAAIAPRRGRPPIRRPQVAAGGSC